MNVNSRDHAIADVTFPQHSMGDCYHFAMSSELSDIDVAPILSESRRTWGGRGCNAILHT